MRYICDPHIYPSVVPTDLEAIRLLAERSGYAGAIHIDVDDGVFAGGKTWPESIDSVAELAVLIARYPHLRFGVHLMVADPKQLGEAFARSGCTSIVAHREAFKDATDASDALATWKAAGAAEVGLALKLETPLAELGGVRGLDFVQLMSIATIGAQGAPFDDHALSRVEELHAEHPELLVAVDGGVTEANIEELVRAGANRLIVGHVLAESSDPERTYGDMLERAMRGCAPLNGGVSGEMVETA